MGFIRYSIAVLLLCITFTMARHHKAEESEVSSDTQPPTPTVETERRHRRKRWYSSYGYQQPIYRDEGPPGSSSNQQPYDPFAYIYRRLDELTAIIRQPPPPIQGPILVPYPVYFSPGCGCPTGGIPANDTPSSGTPPEPMPNITIPNRLGDDVDDYDDVPLRPLSFDPVKPDRPLSRPVPGVEHGSIQGGVPNLQGREPAAFTPAPAFAGASVTPQPSRCDIATLTCCHQRYTTNQCFNNLGCPSALRGGNPCDARTISSIVQVFQNFYRNN